MLETIAFPAISCGVYGYPLEEAAGISLETCREFAGSLREIHFVLLGESTYRVWLDRARNSP